MPENESAGRADSLAEGARLAILAAGIGAVVLGAVTIGWPDKSDSIAELLIGLYLLLSGVLQVVIAFGARFSTALRVLVCFSGVVSVALGLLAFRSGNSVLLLAVWMGLGWCIRGIVHATVAVWDDDLPEGIWQEVFGLLTMVVGLVLIALPFDSLGVLTWATGGCVIVVGALEILTITRGRDEFIALPAAKSLPVTPH